MDESLRAVLRPRICQVDARVRRGIGAYRHEGEEVRRAGAVVDRLCDRLGLAHLDRDLNPGRGKTQLVLAMRDGRGEPVVLKVYGKRRPNEAVVQGLWGEAGVATAGILAAGDDPVSWMLMPLLPGHPAEGRDGMALTPAVARVMAAAHRVYQPGVGEPRDLYTGIGEHLRNVLAAAAAHGYQTPAGIEEIALDVMRSGKATFLHGDLTPVNLMHTDDGAVTIIDTCGYTGPAEFDAARWCARVGGSGAAVDALRVWLAVETGLDASLAHRLLGLELLMEAGVREIVKDEQSLAWSDRDIETIKCLNAGTALLQMARPQ